MARFGQVHHDGTPFPGGIRDGVGRLSDRTVQSCRRSLQWAVDTIAAASSAAASDDVLDMVAAFVEPEVSAVAAFLRERDRDAEEASEMRTPPASGDFPLALNLSLTGLECSGHGESLPDVAEVESDRRLDLGHRLVDLLDRSVEVLDHRHEVGLADVVQRLDLLVVRLHRLVADGTRLGVDEGSSDEVDVLFHDASPSAAEGAEPGLASTASVEGEPAAGGPFPGSPAADLGAALREQSDLLYRELAELRRTPEVLARIRAYRDALGVLTALPSSPSTGAAFFYADAALDTAEAELAETEAGRG